MTVIGKMLTFLVLVLSLAWFYLTANAYVARTNWRAEVKTARAETAAMQQAAEKLKTLVETERDAAEDARKSVVAERDRLLAQVVNLRKDRDDLNAQYTTAFADAAKKAADATRLEANIVKLTDEVRIANEKAAADLAALNKASLEVAAAKAAEAGARLAETAAKKQTEAAQERLIALQNAQEDARQRGAGGLAARNVPVSPDIRGTVTAYDPTGQLVSLTPGLDGGMKVGAVVSVLRLSGGARFLGTVKVTQVDPKEAAGTFTPAAGGPAALAGGPRPGDQVRP